MKISLINSSFYFTYIFLITTGTICFIEALRNPDPKIRHIMNLETCISVVAGYFYGIFVDKVINKNKDKDGNKKHDNNDEDTTPYEEINDMRYTDWMISTPLMLLVLCLVLSYENKIPVNMFTFISILVFNVLMLGSGYMGEINKIPKNIATVLGYVFFVILYGIIWKVFLTGKRTSQSVIIYLLFVILWGFYGVFYMMDKITKVIGYNILDLLAKAFVGIFFWLYLTKSLTL